MRPEKKRYIKLLAYSLLVGIVAGCGALIFYYGLHLTTSILLGSICGFKQPSPRGEIPPFELRPANNLDKRLLVLMPCFGGLVSGFLVYTFAPEAEGHGTDAVIDSYHRKLAKIRGRVPIIKTLASIVTIGSGGSAGREGPIAQIGAGFASILSDLTGLSKREREILLICGAAAGIGSIFRAPFGGSIFGVEVLYLMDYEVDSLLPAVISTFTAYGLFSSIVGWNPIFTCKLFSLITGLISTFYVKTFYRVRDWFRAFKIPNHFKPAIGGLLLGIIAYWIPQALGTGYGWIQLALEEKLPVTLLVTIALAKIFATSFSIGSGGSGGVFAPSLTIGGMIGAGFGMLLRQAFPSIVTSSGVFTIIGMGAFFAAAGKVPIASILMVAEMSGEYRLLMPAFLAASISYAVSGRWSIYESQVFNRYESPAHFGELIEKVTGITVKARKEISKMLKAVKAGEIMSKNVSTVNPEMSLSKLYTLIFESGHHGFPVVENGKVVGMVTMDDLKKIDRKEWEKHVVREVMSRKLYTVYPDETVFDVIKLMYGQKVGRIIVVSKEDPKTLLGIITKKDIIKAYNTITLLTL